MAARTREGAEPVAVACGLMSSVVSVNASERPKEGIFIRHDGRTHGTAGKLFQGDELALEQRINFFPVGNLVGRVFE
jgi:hypothetical protein